MGRFDSLVPLPSASTGYGPRFDPRWKLGATLVGVCAALALQHVVYALLALLGAFGLAFASRLQLRWLMPRIGTVLLAVSIFALPLPLLIDGPGPAWEVGPVKVTSYGAIVGILLAVRAVTVVTLTLTLLATTPLDALLKAAHALGIPGLLVQIGLMTYRYLFLLADELQRLRVAVRVRGFRNAASRHAYQTAGQVAGTLLVRGHDRADRVHHAMRCRGFDRQFHSLTEFRTHLRDVVLFLCVSSVALGLVLLDRVIS